MKLLLMAGLLATVWCAQAQPKGTPTFSIAFTNNQTAQPFGKFAGLFDEVLHLGVRLSYGFDWRSKPRHDWFQQVHAGYFFHRFAQHAIPVYTDFGYRYKLTQKGHLSTAIGLGYMHSIPATSVLEADATGQYSNAKGIGRAQAIATLTLEGRYFFSASSESSGFFFNYQQLLQAPFIKSYVPVLPYNVAGAGFLFSL